MEAAVASSTTQGDAESLSTPSSPAAETTTSSPPAAASALPKGNADSTFASVKQEPGSNPDSPLEASSPNSIAIRVREC